MAPTSLGWCSIGPVQRPPTRRSQARRRLACRNADEVASMSLRREPLISAAEGGTAGHAAVATEVGDHPVATRGAPLVIAPSRSRRIPPKRIGVFGLFGCGNAGNDGSLEAMLLFLRRVRPDAEL